MLLRAKLLRERGRWVEVPITTETETHSQKLRPNSLCRSKLKSSIVLRLNPDGSSIEKCEHESKLLCLFECHQVSGRVNYPNVPAVLAVIDKECFKTIDCPSREMRFVYSKPETKLFHLSGTEN
ncbi:hypothetical protein PoB_005208600 [Plakobranchus ocellatus]|uniref:Uncharacterized protein n=1 Tax=Plakobranchus ocellatus TaxID=259542 RepID=A0AAV4BYI1_9GAST|nr:hypothetical protein PoB_005208600 [Plakobranchus ocellatus]